ncbi:MAG: hypothetical protein DKINENOH_05308 [bacterium]|nr:hypothetical protein [bacterium]MCK6558663.1 heavy metal-binding domain-containing protein [bacterium]NUM64084.1 YbjQ family protein [candidate division KSB1 bacterium]
MMITTTDTIAGRKIVRYLGIVTGEAVIGSNLVDDLFRGLRGIVGGRTSKYEKNLVTARGLALKDMQTNAEQLGANAVVGVDLDYEVFSVGETMMIVIANGTAVQVE